MLNDMFRLERHGMTRSTLVPLVVALLLVVAVVGTLFLGRSYDSVDRLRRFLKSNEKYESLLLVDVVYPLSERMMWILPWKGEGVRIHAVRHAPERGRA
jgi:hypothetical protein